MIMNCFLLKILYYIQLAIYKKKPEEKLFRFFFIFVSEQIFDKVIQTVLPHEEVMGSVRFVEDMLRAVLCEGVGVGFRPNAHGLVLAAGA